MSGKTLLSSTSSTQQTGDTSMTSKAFAGAGNLIKLLPTGTVFLFQYLSPVLSNNGHCHTINKYLTGILLVVCGFICVFASFTDSYTGSDQKKHYGIVTTKGLWPSPASESVNLSAYKLRFGDFVHALTAFIVFAVLALLDTKIVQCFYPEFESSEKVLMQVLPAAIGAVTSAVFVLYPNNRHGIGYPATSEPNDPSSQKSQA
ncbi:protein DMP2-like [Gastrolobium bilobum]|uniref:protein DMP2-like n=1 Tax=Gastrolobium bilobum TaxID=150636 RepID=UPI002AAFD727|nr:protein DMP2-like [Gastrolobium bilobum]